MLCGLWNKDHASCITEATLIEIGVYRLLLQGFKTLFFQNPTFFMLNATVVKMLYV